VDGSGNNYDSSCILDPNTDEGLVDFIKCKSFVYYRSIIECSIDSDISEGIRSDSKLVRVIIKGKNINDDHSKLKEVERSKKGTFPRNIVVKILEGGLISENTSEKHYQVLQACLIRILQDPC
jgi:hypothetical protein